MFTVFLPHAQIEVWIPGIVLLGLTVGFLTGMFGVGGGFLLTPFLKVIFRVPYPIAVGSDLVQIFITSSISAFRHWRHKNMDPKLGAIMAAGALGGTEVGVRVLHSLGEGGTIVINGNTLSLMNLVMSLLFLILMVSVVIMIVRETSRSGDTELQSAISKQLQQYSIPPMMSFTYCGIPSMSMWFPLILSFLVGILTGLLGVGGGFINFPLLVYVIGVPTSAAVGTSAFQIVFASAYGAMRHALQGHVEPLLVGMLLSGSVIGVQIGVYASRLCGGKSIRRYFALVVCVGIIVILFDLARNLW